MSDVSELTVVERFAFFVIATNKSCAIHRTLSVRYDRAMKKTAAISEPILAVVHKARKAEAAEDADALLEQALTQASTVEEKMFVLLDRSDFAASVNDFDGMLDACEEVLDIGEESGYRGNQQIQAGEEEFDPILVAHEGCCWALFQTDETTEALAACINALKIKPDNHRMLLTRGLIRWQLKDDGARADLEEAARLALNIDAECYADCMKALNDIKTDDEFRKYASQIISGMIDAAIKFKG